MLGAVDELDFLPSRHKVVGRSRKTGSAFHSMVVRPYIIYYRVEEQDAVVFILTIRHGRRRQPRTFE